MQSPSTTKTNRPRPPARHPSCPTSRSQLRTAQTPRCTPSMSLRRTTPPRDSLISTRPRPNTFSAG
eukprot:834221-Pleurochrysis_carterae.AAC.1